VNRKLNTLIFIIAATLFYIIAALIFFLALFFVFAFFIAPRISDSAQTWGLTLIFFAALAIAFVLYRLIIKRLAARVDMGKYFSPLFPPGKKEGGPSSR
jgi:hypothetical protein